MQQQRTPIFLHFKKGYSVSLFLLCIFFLLLTCSGCAASKEANTLKDGVQTFVLDNDSIFDTGLDGIETELREKCNKLPALLDIAYFEAGINENGIIKSFTLTVRGYDEGYTYRGNYSFVYDGNNKQMTCNGLDTAIIAEQVSEYNSNWDYRHLAKQIKRLPLKKQIQQLSFPSYKIRFDIETQLNKDTCIIDTIEQPDTPVLSFSDYQKGKGGTSDGHTGVYFLLYDGVSMVSENMMYYLCEPADINTLYGHKDYTMERDYRMSDKHLKFTNDWGETWITSSLTEEDLNATREFYKSNLEIPEGSYFVGKNDIETTAVFYQKQPMLCLSKDSGKSWEKHNFHTSMSLPAVHRFIGFTSSLEGYAALGSDFSMGTGEEKYLYLTHDGGTTWEEKQLPLNGTSHTLTGICFLDNKRGIVSYEASSDSPYPLLYATEDAGVTWNELHVSWDEVNDEVSFLSKVDSLTFENDHYILTLGQGSNGSVKAAFKSSVMTEEWIFQFYYKAVTHTTG